MDHTPPGFEDLDIDTQAPYTYRQVRDHLYDWRRKGQAEGFAAGRKQGHRDVSRAIVRCAATGVAVGIVIEITTAAARYAAH